MTPRRLLIVDGHAALYRAFFAIPALSTAEGQPTNALYGFIRMVRQARERIRPTHWAAVFDGGLAEDRVRLCPEYKAQRPAMPEALRRQIGPVEEYLDRSGMCRVRIEGEEADDVMATLAAQAAAEEARVLLLTSDKDFFQLVDERIAVVPPTDMSAEMGPADVAEKTGVPPARVAEWLALTGDASDNIAGIRGVGPKTAAGLLSGFGSLEALWERLPEVDSERLRKALAEGRPTVERNLRLIRLRRDLPCRVDWERLAVRPEPADALAEFYRVMQLKSLVRGGSERPPDDGQKTLF